jgi:thioredoxin reductase (NADPH)
MATSVPGVFAAGDCTGQPLQIAKAVGDGHVAALSACEYLDNR